MSFWKKAWSGVKKYGPFAAGALGAPVWGVALGKAIVDHVGPGKKDLSVGSVLGSGAKGAVAGWGGGQVGSAAKNVGGWGAAARHPKEFGSALLDQVAPRGPGTAGTRVGQPAVDGIPQAFHRVGASQGSRIPGFLQGSMDGMDGFQKAYLASQAVGAGANAYGAHQEGKMADKQFEIERMLAEERLARDRGDREETERIRARRERMARLFSPMVGEYLAQQYGDWEA